MLRPYQRELSDRAMQMVRAGHRPIICAPCGAGKSYIMRDMAEQTPGEVLVVAHRKELLRQHEDLFADTPNVRLASIFTEARRLGQYSVPALILCDEAHLSEASSYLKVFGYYGAPLVGLTATPSRLDGRPLSAYDRIVQGVSADDLIAAGNLAPYRYYAPTLYDVSELSARYGDYSGDDLAAIMMQSALYGDVLSHYRRLAGGQQAIAYCSTIAHSQAVAEVFNEAGIRAIHIDGTSPSAERREALDGFRTGKYTVLCNVNLISEGISIPECGVILGLRPTMSRALYIQQMCRALRYAPGKEAVLIDFCGNVHRHGMPTADYRYEIGKAVAKPKEFTETGDYAVRVCPNCFRTLESGTAICPYCGKAYEMQPREIKQHQDILLHEIKAEEAKAEQQRLGCLREDLRRARSLDDLLLIARKNGYKKGWAYARAKARGYKLK